MSRGLSPGNSRQRQLQVKVYAHQECRHIRLIYPTRTTPSGLLEWRNVDHRSANQAQSLRDKERQVGYSIKKA